MYEKVAYGRLRDHGLRAEPPVWREQAAGRFLRAAHALPGLCRYRYTLHSACTSSERVTTMRAAILGVAVAAKARIVVTRSEEVQALCRAQGVPVLLHSLPGRNDTVRLGLSALLEQLPELSGCMFLPGDQPLLRRETVEAMTERFCQERLYPAEWQKETEREIFRLGAVAENDPAPLVGSPVLFGSSFFPELLTLPENKGGNVLLKKYPAQVRTVCIADSAELLDADTPEVLQQLEALARQKS